jgi:hypothetical protein
MMDIQPTDPSLPYAVPAIFRARQMAEQLLNGEPEATTGSTP